MTTGMMQEIMQDLKTQLNKLPKAAPAYAAVLPRLEMFPEDPRDLPAVLFRHCYSDDEPPTNFIFRRSEELLGVKFLRDHDKNK